MPDFYAVILDRDRDDNDHVSVLEDQTYDALKQQTFFPGPTRLFSRAQFVRYHCLKKNWVDARDNSIHHGSIFKLKV
jgi:hypothetical protein